MKSTEFLIELQELENFRDIEISSIHIDSREVQKGGVFFALKGHTADGNEFISSALDRGASLVVSDTYQREIPGIIYFAQLRELLGLFVSRFYQYPSKKINTICVTGTNGKTTSVETFASMSNLLGNKCAYMSTINFSKEGKSVRPSNLTTPDVLKINENIMEALHHDARYISMEASSHGLEQCRLNALDIDYAILTSFSHDHLDYHGDLESYKSAKEKLFFELNPKKNIISIDSPFGEKIYSELKGKNAECFSISIKNNADFQATFERCPVGLLVNLKTKDQQFSFELATISRYLASNILCSIAVLMLEGIDAESISKVTKQIRLPAGRLEQIKKHDHIIYIDYAHTPAALETALEEIRNYHQEKVWCLFGCGGDRDKEKRSLMGSIAEKYSDFVVITSDNPRYEDGSEIINDILSGITNREKVSVEPDRKKAIQKTILELNKNSEKKILLVAGKGHENYQEIEGHFYDFNDKQVIQSI